MTNKTFLKLDGRETKHTALVCKALASEIRLEILQILVKKPISVTELSALLELPISTVAGHLNLLETAGLVSSVPIPGSRGNKKICNPLVEKVEIDIIRRKPNVQFSNCLYSQDMPIGNYFDFEVSAPCGLASADGFLAPDDDSSMFALPNHVNAQIIWLSKGYLEYRFDLKSGDIDLHSIDRVEFSLEICAEAYGYDEQWRSDVSVQINGIQLGSMICRGDHGGRPGKLNPPWWPEYATQFGDLHHIILTRDGSAVDGNWVNSLNLSDIYYKNKGSIRLKIGVKEESKYVGGLNFFGNHFGDHTQGILMNVYGTPYDTNKAKHKPQS